MRLSKLRPLRGRSLICCSPTTPDTADVVVFTSGVSPATRDLLREFAQLQPKIDHRFLPDD